MAFGLLVQCNLVFTRLISCNLVLISCNLVLTRLRSTMQFGVYKKFGVYKTCYNHCAHGGASLCNGKLLWYMYAF